MNKPTTPITRNCLACGLEKPLAAFLQISGTQGTVYGNICSTCRSTGAKNKVIIPGADEDDRSGGGAGLRIDAKAKLQIEIDKKLREKNRKENIQEEIKNLEDLTLEKTERKEIKEKAEKDHKEFLEAKKKQGFLGIREKKPSATTLPGFISHHQQAMEAQKLDASIELEKKKTTVDTSQLYLDSQFGEVKFQTEIFKRFKDWLGAGANFRVMEQLYKRTPDQKKQATDKKKDPFVEFIEKTDKPSSTRRR